LSFKTISLATVTPSFVDNGAPKSFLMTTLRHFGPNVTITALANVFTPDKIDFNAASSNFNIFGIVISFMR